MCAKPLVKEGVTLTFLAAVLIRRRQFSLSAFLTSCLHAARMTRRDTQCKGLQHEFGGLKGYYSWAPQAAQSVALGCGGVGVSRCDEMT
jgi:hypothetical protein